MPSTHVAGRPAAIPSPRAFRAAVRRARACSTDSTLHPKVHHGRTGGSLERLEQTASQQIHLPGFVAVGFGDELERAIVDGAQHRLGNRAGLAGHDDDGPRGLAHDITERIETAQIGHLQVESDDVRLELVHEAYRLVTCLRLTDHFEVGRAVDDVAEDRAHQLAVIDDENGPAPCGRFRE
jgi:hypothetical protein